MGSDGGKDFWVRIPEDDAFMVFSAVLIVDDEGDDLMAQAFFEHDQSAEAAVTVFEGVDPFETDIKI